MQLLKNGIKFVEKNDNGIQNNGFYKKFIEI